MAQIKLYKTYKELSEPYIGKMFKEVNVANAACYYISKMHVNPRTRENEIVIDKLSSDATLVIYRDYVSYPLSGFLEGIKNKQFMFVCKQDEV